MLALALTSSAALLVPAIPAMSASQASTSVAATPTDETVVDESTTWTYLEDDTDPVRGGEDPLAWTRTGFDATGWTESSGSFGAKDGALGDLGGGLVPDTLLRHYINGTAAPTVPTYYFRTSFEADSTDEVRRLVGEVTYDDGVRIFLNGERVAGFHDGAVPAGSPRQYAGSNSAAPNEGTFEVPGDRLRDGTNTLAVALYQSTSGSSDIYLDLSSLTALIQDRPPTRVVLTPTEDPATSQAVSWAAGESDVTAGQVEIRPSGGTPRTVPATSVGTGVNGDKQHFSAVVEGLQPGTAYEYRVGNTDSWSPWHTFTTADPADEEWSFIYYGDTQVGLTTTWPAVVGQANTTAPDAIGSVHAGDLVDTGGDQSQWLSWFDGMADSAATSNVLAAPGNHESYGDGQLKNWKAHFTYPGNNPSRDNIGELADLAEGATDVARQYAAYFDHWADVAAETIYYSDYQDVRFVTLNASGPGWNDDLITPANLPACNGSTCPSTKVADVWAQFQAAWLDLLLQDNPSKWSVATFHQPVYSASTGRDEPVLREWWVPVFQKHDVDLVLMGHDHVYARGYNNADATETPGLTTGPVYVVSNSGAKDYELDKNEADNVWTRNGATRVHTGENISTYGVVDVTGDSLRYRSYLAEKRAGASTDAPIGSMFDEFTVHKSDADEKYVAEPGVGVPAEPEPVVPPGRGRVHSTQGVG